MDIVCPLAYRDGNEELRYSMRSFVENVPHGRFWVVGHVPRWLSDEAGAIPMVQGSDRWRNTSDALLEAIDDDRISDPFIATNDDFFAIAKSPRLNFDRGPLNGHVLNNRRATSYRSGAVHALQTLDELDIVDARSYELHMPIVVDKLDMLVAIELLRSRRRNEGFKRSVYGNLRDRETVTREDVKVDGHYAPTGGEDWLSTSDSSFDKGKVGEWLRASFQIPSRYEKKGSQ